MSVDATTCEQCGKELQPMTTAAGNPFGHVRLIGYVPHTCSTVSCPDCKLTMDPAENPHRVQLTLTDKRAAYRFDVTREQIIAARGRDPIAEAQLRLRHEQRKARSCRCNGTGVVPAA